MATRIGSGQSKARDTRAGAEEAIKQALEPLPGKRASFGFIFASPCHDLRTVTEVARSLSPQAEFVAASSGGGFTERGLVQQGIVVLAVSTQQMLWDATYASGISRGVTPVASSLCTRFRELKASAMDKGFPYSNTVLLLDGLTGVGEALVDEVLRHTGLTHQVVGGAAADDWNLQATHVAARGQAGKDAATTLHVFSHGAWGVGVEHGRCPASSKMEVTKSKGSTVYELDGRPAIEAYRALAKAQPGMPKDDKALIVGHELGLYFVDEVRKARAVLGVGADGSLSCAADVPQHATVSILGGDTASMVSAARRAAQEAKDGLRKNRAAGVLVFDCVSRLSLMTPAGFGREIEAIASVFPGVPVAGFHTYGEIARFKGRMDGWHNTTAVVVAIPE
ncbi:MAG: FIST N-terminal domain-containing protein [Myxococcales bacterium]